MARAGRLLKVPLELESIDGYVENSNYDCIKMLTDMHGIDCYDVYKRTFLILAAAKGNIDVMKYLLDNGADTNFQDKNGYCALHFAAQNNHIDITEMLLHNGANPNLRDIHGNPPIWTAIMNNKSDFTIVKLLLKNKADIDTKNNYEKSPREMWNLRFDRDIETLAN